MGTVYRAVDKLDGAVVALKLLRGTQAIDIERFEREASVLAELRHPGIVRYVAHGVSGAGERYLAMEWLDGEDLAARIARQRLSVSESLRLVRRTVAALAFAHARGLVHRDIKPSNIFVLGGDVERIKLVDFGIARISREHERLTGTGVVLGTPGYMAPEQLESPGQGDPRADVFSIGCVLFECVTGRCAFEGAHVMAVLAKILLQETPRARNVRPDLPEALELLIGRMMAKAPADRFPDAAAVERELIGLGEIDLGPPPSAPRNVLATTLAAASDRAPISITRNENRLVTVVFAGDPDAQAAVSKPQATPALEAALDLYGGQLTELPGRSLIVTQWGAGSAVDRAERAAQCALTLRAHLPEVSICVATGRGLVSARVVEGEIIDRGVRMLQRTRPGAIKLDDVSAGMLEARVQVVRQGGSLVLGSDRIQQGARPRLLGKPSTFLGRTRELSTLESVLTGCVSEPVASAVLVIGPAGTGKSRLRLEFLEKVQLREPVEIVCGWADSLCPGTPFGIIADAVRRAAGIRDGDPLESKRLKLEQRLTRTVGRRDLDSIAPFLGELIGVPFPDRDDKALRAARENAMLMGDAMRAAWEAWLEKECAAHPVLLVLEDLHWGDAASVRLIDSTLRNLRDLPLMVLVLARPGVNAQFPGLWAERDVQTIKLGSLARRSSEKLVRDALGPSVSAAVVERVLDRADGNPFYLEELVRAVAAGREETLPDSVLGTVEARLDAEGSEAKRVLRAASVFGERFSQSAVTWLLGGDAHRKDIGEWLEALASHELVTRAGFSAARSDTDYAFRHTLVREAAYAMLTDGDRTLGHRLAGEWLENNGSSDATAMAEHFRRGGEPARSVRWYRRAAEQALEANELEAAIDRAEQGVSCGAAGEELGLLRLIEAEASVWHGEVALGEERGLEAIRLLPTTTPAWFRAVTQVVLAAGKLGGFDRIGTWVEAAIEAVPAAGAYGLQLTCLSRAAINLMFGGHYVPADALITRIDRAVGNPASLDPQTADVIQQMRAFRAVYAGDSAAGLGGFTAALAATEEIGDRRDACSIRCNLGFILSELGDFVGAEEALRRSLGDADHMGLHDLATVARHNLGHVLAYRGSLDEARMLEQRAVEAFRTQGDPRMEGVARTYLAKIALLSGDLGTAEREARAASEALRVAPPVRAAAVAILARVLLALGRPADALPIAREAFGTLESLGMLEEGEALVRLVHAEALAAMGLADEFTTAITSARALLLARGAKISDPSWRRRFLTAVPDNARTLELAERTA